SCRRCRVDPRHHRGSTCQGASGTGQSRKVACCDHPIPVPPRRRPHLSDQPFCRLVLDFERYARTVGVLKPYSLQDYAGTSHGPAREEAGSAELAPCPAACVRGASVFESTRKRTSRTVISLSGAA